MGKIGGKDLIKVFGVVFGLLAILILVVFLIKPEPAMISFVINLGFFLIVLIILILFLKKKKISWEEFGFSEIKFRWIFFSFLLIFLVIGLGGFLSQLFSKLLNIPTENLSFFKAIVSDKAWLNILNLKLGVAILVPFAEEVLFRGFLFKYIRQEKSFIFSAILSSVLFSLMHFSLDSLPFTLLLGLSTAFAYEKGKSLFYPFLIHMGVNNLASIMLLMNIL